MNEVIVIYHSGYGHTQAIAQAVSQGAKADLVSIDAQGNVDDKGWSALHAAQAIVFGSPTYMGMVSWQFKKFAEATSKQWMDRSWVNKVAGGFTVSAGLSGDKLSSLQYMVTLAMQLGMVWVGQISIDEHKYLDGKNRLGAYTGVMAQCGPTEPATAIPTGDIATAHAYGEHIRQVVSKIKT
jgi:multimeric flavodoxin WrbA